MCRRGEKLYIHLYYVHYIHIILHIIYTHIQAPKHFVTAKMLNTTEHTVNFP